MMTPDARAAGVRLVIGDQSHDLVALREALEVAIAGAVTWRAIALAALDDLADLTRAVQKLRSSHAGALDECKRLRAEAQDAEALP